MSYFYFAGFGNVPPIETLGWLPSRSGHYVKKKLKNATLIGHSLGGTSCVSLSGNQFVQN
jgi:hypothetical protein